MHPSGIVRRKGIGQELTLEGKARQMIEKRRNQGRRLRAEQLEKRELLAANLGHCVAAPPEASEVVVTATVDEMPLQQRERSSEDNGTGDGMQKRPRDRASENAVATLVASEADGTGPEAQFQERTRTGEGSDTGQGDR